MSKLLCLLIILCLGVKPSYCQDSPEQNQSFYLQYLEPSEETLFYAQLLEDSKIVDDAIADLNDFFALPHPVLITFGSGIPGPQYNGDGTINMPYEFMLTSDLVLGASELNLQPDQAAAMILNTESLYCIMRWDMLLFMCSIYQFWGKKRMPWMDLPQSLPAFGISMK